MEDRVDPGRDEGMFGPESVSWRVLREGSVVVGGLRALLMHAAHPLVVAGARQTGMYEVTGLRYDARDPDLLLWVHACLVSGFLEMERRTLGKLDDAARQRFHEEQMLAVEPLRLPRQLIPPTVEALDAYVDQVIASGILRRTDDAMAVASLVREPPDGVPRRWLWRLISFLSFHTLPPALRELYGVRHTLRHELALRAVCWTMRHDRPLMPPRWRFIAPALAAGARLRGENASVSGAGLFLRGAGWRVPRPRLDHAGSRQSR